jgi:transposase
MKSPNYEAAGYDTDLTNAEWELIEPLFYPAGARRGRGRRRAAHAARASPGAIRYILKAGCQWSLLSKDFPPESL